MLHSSANTIEKYIAINDNINQENSDAGPAFFAPRAGKKNIPVPIIEFMVIRSITGKLSTFFNSAIIINTIYKYII